LQQHSYFSENLYLATYELYLEAVDKMMSFLEYNSENSNKMPLFQSSTQDSNIPVFFHHARLPRIDIPKSMALPLNGYPLKIYLALSL